MPGPGGIGFSVSEPVPTPLTAGGPSPYYPEPVAKNPVTLVYDAYDDLTQTTHATGATGFLDQPLEEGPGEPTYQQLPLLQDVAGPGSAANTGTYPNYKTVFLQRLADPTSGYDSLRNPYITVDWMPIDLTVFNGEDPSSNLNDHPKTINFSSRQRGGSGTINTTPVPAPSYNIWAPLQISDTLANVPPFGASGNANFSYQLNHTLGYLNHGYGTGLTATTYPGLTQYVGDPSQPFPWITWNARPYASEFELLNVPASSPDRLLFEFNSPATPVSYGPTASPTVLPAPPASLAPDAHDGRSIRERKRPRSLRPLAEFLRFVGFDVRGGPSLEFLPRAGVSASSLAVHRLRDVFESVGFQGRRQRRRRRLISCRRSTMFPTTAILAA